MQAHGQITGSFFASTSVILANRFVVLTGAVNGSDSFTHQMAVPIVAQVSVAGVNVLGVTVESVSANAITNIVLAGIAQIESGAAISVGATISTDASGRAITQTGAAVSLGIALNASGPSGVTVKNKIISVLLLPHF